MPIFKISKKADVAERLEAMLAGEPAYIYADEICDKSRKYVFVRNGEGKEFGYILKTRDGNEGALEALVSEEAPLIRGIFADGCVEFPEGGEAACAAILSPLDEYAARKAEEIGMPKADALARCAHMRRYALDDAQAKAVVDFWRKPCGKVAGNIPPVGKIIYVDDEKRQFKRVVGHVVMDGESALRIVGPMSTGKNVFVESLASLLYKPLLEVDMQKNTESEDFEGSCTLSYKQVGEGQYVQTLEFVEQPLLTAMECGAWINFNEINFAMPHVLSRLHRVLDGRKSIYVPAVGEVKAHEGFAFLSTMNPPKGGYIGTGRLNEAFESRLMTIRLEPAKSLKKLFRQKYPEADEKDVDALDKLYGLVLNAHLAGELGESFLALRRWEAALAGRGFGTLKEAVQDNLCNVSCNSAGEEQMLNDLILMAFAEEPGK